MLDESENIKYDLGNLSKEQNKQKGEKFNLEQVKKSYFFREGDVLVC